ncbi:regulator of chromosome condensation 1/beta-lactamase-inhibitor protein II [Gongronella butleri]|nr:regulator of chromosome condensation 1/beta-lactamase-inhibitor protein II [Gongronella butleri]
MSRSLTRSFLYGWGHTKPLPLTRSPTHLSRPVLLNDEADFALPTDVQVTRMATGWGHSLLANDHHVYGFGLNQGHQLGQPDRAHVVHTLGGDERVKHLGCGREHSHMVVARTGHNDALYSMGNSMYGQLGLGEHKSTRPGQWITRAKPSRVSTTATSIVDLACGLDHSVFSTDDATYAMGWGADGQLGQGEDMTMDQSRPHRVALDGKVKKLSSSTDFTLALMDDDQLWVWGNSEYGQGMQGRKIDRILSPLHVTTTKKVVDMAAGGPFSIVLTDDGQVLSCGYGSLGHGPDQLESLKLAPVHGLDNVVVTRVFAATDYAAALSASGELFIWGLNGPTGRLGLGHDHHAFTAARVDFNGKQVKDVVLGTNHALAVCV